MLIDQDASGCIDYEVSPVGLAGGVPALPCLGVCPWLDDWLAEHGMAWHQSMLAKQHLSCLPLPARSVQEFIAATLSQHQMEKAENMAAAFRHFDTDGSGTISKRELHEALRVGGWLGCWGAGEGGLLKGRAGC